MLSRVLGVSSAALAAHPERPLDAASHRRYLAWIERRCDGEPVAYLLGEREFYGRSFGVSPAVLIPRPETELLVDRALAHCAPGRGPRILDLGTGSGAVAITLKLEQPAAAVTATEVCAEALAVARDNARRLGADIRFIQGDWYGGVGDQRFDLIVANPPYVAADDPHLTAGDLRFEPRRALVPGPRGTEALARLIADAPHHLAGAGWLLLEHGHDQGAHCRALLTQAGLAAVETWRDLAGIERVSGGRGP